MKNKCYKIQFEHKNITGYSPFCHINEIPAKYHKNSFKLPLIKHGNKTIPMHPIMFKDLKLTKKDIVRKIRVYPTSSTRTVYCPEKKVFWKLPVNRMITRGLRDLKNSQLERSELAQSRLTEKCKHFSFLSETSFLAEDENFNYIERNIPSVIAFPLFYIVQKKRVSRKFIMTIIENIIASWMFWAEKGLLLEYHTQNILVDEKGQIIYRDLSDIKSFDDSALKPSFYHLLKNNSELVSIIFDRAVCNQNLDHFDRYKKFTAKEKGQIKTWIKEYSEKHKVIFPDYSLDFDPDQAARTPVRKDITRWRAC